MSEIANMAIWVAVGRGRKKSAVGVDDGHSDHSDHSRGRNHGRSFDHIHGHSRGHGRSGRTL